MLACRACTHARTHARTRTRTHAHTHTHTQVVGVHRKETFEALAEIMDRLKKRVPIWKLEVWEDGATWKDGALVDPAA